MGKVRIIDIDQNPANEDEVLIYEGERWGATDALVAAFFPNGTGKWDEWQQSIYNACLDLGDAIAKGEPTSAYEVYLGVKVI